MTTRPIVGTLLRMAKRFTMGRRTVPINDMEQGIVLALMYLDEPAKCRCSGCVMNTGCAYERQLGFETERQDPLPLFGVRD